MGHREEHFEFGIADFGFILPKLSDSSGRHEYRQHHPCHSESAAGGRRIFWVEPPSEILRRLSAPQNDSERRIAQFR